jgi:Trypsin-co-occurring domain 1
VARLVEFDLDQGGSVLVEVEEGSGAVTRGRPADAVTKAGDNLEEVMGRLGPALRGIVSQLRASADWPDQVDVEFAVKLSTDANVIIARTGGEANFRIALRWTREDG